MTNRHIIHDGHDRCRRVAAAVAEAQEQVLLDLAEVQMGDEPFATTEVRELSVADGGPALEVVSRGGGDGPGGLTAHVATTLPCPHAWTARTVLVGGPPEERAVGNVDVRSDNIRLDVVGVSKVVSLV